MTSKLYKKLLCSHKYVTTKTSKDTDYFNKKIRGTRLECQKCNKVKFSVEFLD